MNKTIKDANYLNWLGVLKQQFRQTQLKAVVKVNQALLQFYWHLGNEILINQQQTQWGDGFLTQLSQDLMAEFPEVKGFSARNLKYIRQWRSFYAAIGQQAVARLSTTLGTQYRHYKQEPKHGRSLVLRTKRTDVWLESSGANPSNRIRLMAA